MKRFILSLFFGRSCSPIVQTETINRLLKKQSSRSRAKRNAMLNSSVVPTPQAQSGDEAESDGGALAGAMSVVQEQFRRTIPGPTWRWISNKDGIVLGIPNEVLQVVQSEKISTENGGGTEVEKTPKVEFPKLEVVMQPKSPSKCDVSGCGNLRKYRLVNAFEKGACGMEHLKLLSGKGAV